MIIYFFNKITYFPYCFDNKFASIGCDKCGGHQVKDTLMVHDKYRRALEMLLAMNVNLDTEN